MSKHDKNEEVARKAKRDLNRVNDQSDTLGTSALARMSKSATDRFKAADVDQDDKIELWGSRIGRGLGLIFAVILVVHLFVTYVLN